MMIFVRLGLLFFILSGLFGIPMEARAVDVETVVALTSNNELIRFSSNAPGTVDRVIPISGLQVGEHLIAIDFQPCKCGLYGIGDSNRFYLINPETGLATPSLQGGGTVSLPVGDLGTDLHPGKNQFSVVNFQDQHRVYSPIYGEDAARPALVYAIGDPHFSQNPNVVDLAFTKSIPDSNITTLFGIDVDTDSLVRVGNVDSQSDDSSLLHTIGPMGIDADAVSGFDITSVSGEVAMAVIRLHGDAIPKLYQINLSTGAATLSGSVNSGYQIKDIALALAGSLEFERSTISVDEGAGNASIKVLRVGSPLGTVSVKCQSFDGTATGGVDYQPFSQVLTFVENDNTPKTLQIPISEDALSENDETFALILSDPQGGVLLGQKSAVTVTILDNELTSNGTPPPGSEDTGVVVRMKAPKKVRIKALRKNGIKFSISCSGPCSGTSSVILDGKKGKVLAKGKFNLPAGLEAKVKLKSTKTLKRMKDPKSSLKARTDTKAISTVGVLSTATQALRILK